MDNLSWDFSHFIIWISPVLLFIRVVSSCKAIALQSSVHDTLPQINLITDDSVDDKLKKQRSPTEGPLAPHHVCAWQRQAGGRGRLR